MSENDNNNDSPDTSDLTLGGEAPAAPDMNTILARLEALEGRHNHLKSDVIRTRKKVDAEPAKDPTADIFAWSRISKGLPDKVLSSLEEMAEGGASISEVVKFAKFYKENYTSSQSEGSEKPTPVRPPGQPATGASRMAKSTPKNVQEWLELKKSDPARHRELMADPSFDLAEILGGT